MACDPGALAGLGVVELRERVQLLCRLVGELTVMAEGRAPIEQAKGVLMALHGVDAEQAFTVLRTRSQDTNTVLRDVAAALVADTQHHADPSSRVGSRVGGVGGRGVGGRGGAAADRAPADSFR